MEAQDTAFPRQSQSRKEKLCALEVILFAGAGRM